MCEKQYEGYDANYGLVLVIYCLDTTVSSAYNTSLIYCLVIYCVSILTTEGPGPLRSRAIRRLVVQSSTGKCFVQAL